MEEFEKWLRTVCFQKPTPEAYDLAKESWQKSKELEREACAIVCENIDDRCSECAAHNDHEQCLVPEKEQYADAIRKRANAALRGAEPALQSREEMRGALRAERMREAGFTRRPSLPSDE